MNNGAVQDGRGSGGFGKGLGFAADCRAWELPDCTGAKAPTAAREARLRRRRERMENVRFITYTVASHRLYATRVPGSSHECFTAQEREWGTRRPEVQLRAPLRLRLPTTGRPPLDRARVGYRAFPEQGTGNPHREEGFTLEAVVFQMLVSVRTVNPAEGRLSGPA